MKDYIKDKHFKLEDFSRDNDHLYVMDPDPDFSPEHNYSVIQNTINKYRKMRYGVDDKVKFNSGNVADILSEFAKYKLDKGGEKKLEDWLGKENLARIYGEKLISKLKVLDSVRRLNKARGNTKFGDHFLT